MAKIVLDVDLSQVQDGSILVYNIKSKHLVATNKSAFLNDLYSKINRQQQEIEVLKAEKNILEAELESLRNKVNDLVVIFEYTIKEYLGNE